MQAVYCLHSLSGFHTLMQVCSKNLWLPLRTMLPFSGSEASTCRAAIRAAKNIVSDLGEQTAARSRGLVELGKCTESHSERDVNRVARKYQLLLPVKLSNFPKALEFVSQETLKQYL